MALIRERMAKSLKRVMPLLNQGRGIKTMSRTVPKMKAYTAATDGAEPNKGKAKSGNYIPLYVALGMIGLSVALGLHTAKQQFMHAPDVRVKKSRRETVAEVDEPERVARESQNLIKNSFFRKVANVQDTENPIDNSVHGDPLTREGRVESLKKAGVNPSQGNDSDG